MMEINNFTHTTNYFVIIKVMKFKNKSAANDSPTTNSIDGEAPSTKRKKRKTDPKNNIDTDANAQSVTRKKKKESIISDPNDSSVDIAINNVNNFIPNETNEKEI